MRALVLEDNLPLAQSLTEILSTTGWEAHSSYSWSEASRLMDKHSFDLFVLDILLPDKKGFEILKILSKKPINPSLNIILISGFVEETFVMKNIPENLKAYCRFFKKPIDEKSFLNFLQKIRFPDSDQKEVHFFKSFFEKDCHLHLLNVYLPQNKTFDSQDLIFAIYLTHLKQFTGELKIIADKDKETFIQFHKGHIIKLVSNSNKSFFGALLVEQGLSLQEDIESLLDNKEPHKLMGEKLVERGLLSPYMLNFMLKEQIKIRLSEIMSYPSFKLKITKKPLENDEMMDIDFNETDFIEWLADSLQTELKSKFFENLYLGIRSGIIQKSSQINKTVVYHKQFLQEYNFLFKNLNEGSEVENIVSNSENKIHILRLLYFGLLTKSLYLKSQKKEIENTQKMNLLLDSIMKKDSEDLFALLNLPWNASPEEAEKNYKQLIQKMHPDLLPLNASKQLKEKSKRAFHKITKGYEILRDERKRKEYMRVQKEENFVTVMKKYEKGLTKIKQENYETGLKIFLQIVDHKHAPSNTPLYVLWAKLKSNSDDLTVNRKKAVNIQKAIDSCPISLRTSPLFWYIKGLFFSQTKQYEKALEFFNKSLRVQKDFSEAKKELIFINRKIKYSQTNNKKQNFLDFFFKKSS